MKLVLKVILFMSAVHIMSIYFNTELIMHNLWIVVVCTALCVLWIIFKVYRSMQIEDGSVCIQLSDE